MSLRRTASGLLSLHLFFRVEIVVYCEGGTQQELQDVLNGAGQDETLDVVFWQRIVEYVGATKSYHFKSVGSKSLLSSIAKDVSLHNIDSVIVCLDRDFDWHRGKRLCYRNVVYTHGYSWENDAVSLDSMEKVFFKVLSRNNNSLALFEELSLALSEFSERLVRWCEFEIELSTRDCGQIFPRKNPVAVIDLQAAIPRLKEEILQKKLAEIGFSRGPRVKMKITKDEVWQHAWGKLISRYAYHLVTNLFSKRDPAIKISYDVFMRFVISEFIEAMRLGRLEATSSYYRSIEVFR